MDHVARAIGGSCSCGTLFSKCCLSDPRCLKCIHGVYDPNPFQPIYNVYDSHCCQFVCGVLDVVDGLYSNDDLRHLHFNNLSCLNMLRFTLT